MIPCTPFWLWIRFSVSSTSACKQKKPKSIDDSCCLPSTKALESCVQEQSCTKMIQADFTYTALRSDMSVLWYHLLCTTFSLVFHLRSSLICDYNLVETGNSSLIFALSLQPHPSAPHCRMAAGTLLSQTAAIQVASKKHIRKYTWNL